MAPPQPALRSVEPHIHPFTETCPTCEQPIPNDKAQEIRARAAEMQKRLADAADARAAQKIETEKARFAREKDEALRQASVDAAAKAEAAKAEGRKSAETDFQARIAASEKAKTDAETAAAQKVAAAEQAASTQKEEAQRANTEKAQALAKVQQVEAQRDAAVETRAREVREAMEKDKAGALAKLNSENDEKTRKLLVQVQTLERKLEEKRADELGEGAHIQLLDALKAEFPEDYIRRISPGVSGADILHTVMRNGVSCGAILYESKNSTAWRDDYVTKLVRDQTAAEADHAILSTFKFPKDTDQVEIRDSVIIVKPARAVAVAQLLRKHLLHVHTLQLSKSDRQEKMAELYHFMTSERYVLLTGRLDTESEALLKLQDHDKKYHDRHWQKEGLAIRSLQKVKAEIDTAVELIIGRSPETELTE